MQNSVEYWEEKIRECLRCCNRYTPALDLNIFLAAGALMRYDKALRESATLDTVSWTGPNGAKQQHPAFKMQIDTEVSILRYLKELGLTAEGTRGQQGADPMAEILESVRAALK